MTETDAKGAAAGADLRNAILLIDKPEGKTSFDIVERVRRITGAARSGHSGTLDRFASGLLVVCNGTSTKLARYLIEDDKTYTGTVKLGATTDTDDREGAVIEERPAAMVTRDGILASAGSLTGVLFQQPPLYSALKINGKRASDRMRNGERVDLAARKVTVFDFEVREFDRDNARFNFRVRCSKGTYVRSLARDIGGLLGTGAHLESLRRIGAGIFSVDDAVGLSGLEDYVRTGAADRRFYMRPVEALADYGSIRIDEFAAGRVRNGAVFPRECALKIDDKGGKTFIITDEHENLIAIADADIREWQIKYLNVFNI